MDHFISVEDIKTELEEVEIPVPLWMQVDNGEEDPLALTNVKIEEFGGSEELHFSQDLKSGVEPKVEDEVKPPSTVLYGCPMTSEEGIHFKKPVVLESVAKVKDEQPFCSYTSEINPKLEAYTEKFDIKSKSIILELVAEVQKEEPSCSYASKIKSELEGHTEKPVVLESVAKVKEEQPFCSYTSEINPKLEAYTEKFDTKSKRIILELVAEVQKEEPSCSYASKVKSELEGHTEDIGREQDIDLAECEIPSASTQHCHQLEVCRIRSREVKPNETSTVFKQITYKCKICNYVFVCEKLYKRQLLKQVDDNLFSCDQCDFKTLYKNILNDHMTKHTGDKTFRCNICRYICCKCNYKRFSCNACHFKSSTFYGLRCHYQRMHINDKTFLCKLCQFKSSTADSLRCHMRRKHNKPVKPSACNLYQYKCSESGDLKKHMIINLN